MITNYTELKQEVIDWSHRTDTDNLTSKMDTFCQLAENIINYGFELNGRPIPGLRAQEMEKRDAQSFDATFFDLPSDYIEMKALEIEYNGRRNPIRQISPQLLDSTYSTATGPPQAYTLQANQIEFRPGIDATSPYMGELIYYAQVPTLISNTTNDVLAKYPSIYLAAMLLQLNIYTQDEEQTEVWFGSLMSIIRGANKSKGSYVLPQVRMF